MLKGRFVNLFDPELAVQRSITLEPGRRVFLLDLKAAKTPEPRVVASACKALLTKTESRKMTWTVEGVGDTPAIMLIASDKPPRSVGLSSNAQVSHSYNSAEGLIYIRFNNEAWPRELVIEF